MALSRINMIKPLSNHEKKDIPCINWIWKTTTSFLKNRLLFVFNALDSFLCLNNYLITNGTASVSALFLLLTFNI